MNAGTRMNIDATMRGIAIGPIALTPRIRAAHIATMPRTYMRNPLAMSLVYWLTVGLGSNMEFLYKELL